MAPTSLLAWSLATVLTSPPAATAVSSAPPSGAPAPPTAIQPAAPAPPTATPPAPAPPPATQPAAPVAGKPTVAGRPGNAGKSAPVLPDWRARVAIGIKTLESSDPDRLARLSSIQPDRGFADELTFKQPEVQDPRAAPVLLRRLMQGEDNVRVRCALVDALPATGGDGQEGAAALVGIDASPAVRKKLVEVMRYVDPPHSLHGLRLGFKDEDPEVNIAAARTAGFSRSGPELFPELFSSTFDTNWDLRAAAVQALGMLRLPQSREVLLKALYDDDREVRLQGLLALEQLDPDGIAFLPEIDRLARDRKSHRIARKADALLKKRRAMQKGGIVPGAPPPAPTPAPAPPVAAPPAKTG